MAQFFAHPYKKILQLLLNLTFILISLAVDGFAHAASFRNNPEKWANKVHFSKEYRLGNQAADGIQKEKATSEKKGISNTYKRSAMQPHHHLSPNSTGASKYLENSRLKTPAAVHVGNRDVTILENIAGGGAIITTDVESIAMEAKKDDFSEAYYFVYGSGYTPDQEISLILSVTDPGPFTITYDGSYSKTITMVITISSEGTFEQMLGVKYAPTDGGPHDAIITHDTDGAVPKEVTLNGNVTSTPVEWLSFSALAVKESIVLNWITASEKNNSHFEVEISKNPATGFEKIGRVNSKAGNSKLPIRYRYTHYLGFASGTYYLRLKQVDTDHIFSYSQLLAIEIPATGEVKLKILAPNPIALSSRLRISVAEAGKLNIKILSIKGMEVLAKSYNLESGENRIALLLDNKLPAGIYILTAEFKESRYRLKLIKE